MITIRKRSKKLGWIYFDCWKNKIFFKVVLGLLWTMCEDCEVSLYLTAVIIVWKIYFVVFRFYIICFLFCILQTDDGTSLSKRLSMTIKNIKKKLIITSIIDYPTYIIKKFTTQSSEYIKLNNRVGLAERLAYKPANQAGPGSNPPLGNRLKI